MLRELLRPLTALQAALVVVAMFFTVQSCDTPTPPACRAAHAFDGAESGAPNEVLASVSQALAQGLTAKEAEYLEGIDWRKVEPAIALHDPVFIKALTLASPAVKNRCGTKTASRPFVSMNAALADNQFENEWVLSVAQAIAAEVWPAVAGCAAFSAACAVAGPVTIGCCVAGAVTTYMALKPDKANASELTPGDYADPNRAMRVLMGNQGTGGGSVAGGSASGGSASGGSASGGSAAGGSAGGSAGGAAGGATTSWSPSTTTRT